MWFQWNAYQQKRYKESYLPSYRKCEIKKGHTQILIELIYLLFYWKCLPYHYFRYGLYRRKFNLKKILDFIPETIIYYKILPKINFNHILLDDKNIFELIMKGSKIPIPDTIFKIQSKKVTDGNNNPINETEFQTILRGTSSLKIFAKPSKFGSGGKGILEFNKSNGKFYTKKNEELNLNFINEILEKDWIFQEGIQNNDFIKSMHKYSLNTFRVMTLSQPRKDAVVMNIVLKIGNNKSSTDNAHTSGIYVGVHLDGKLMDTGYDENLNEFNKHPLTNFEFSGQIIPEIKSVIDLSINCANLFPSIKYIGWDIALTNAGPVVIEGNSSPGLTIIQRTHNGMRSFYDTVNNNLKNFSE